MKTRDKILLTILLATLFVWLFGCRTQEHPVPAPSTTNGTVDAAYLSRLYRTYNEGYFHNRLTQIPVIDMFEGSDEYMATTLCSDGGTNCILHFNRKFVAAPRVAEFTMLHEQCHIKMWGKEATDHGKLWRSCMLQLDEQGAFREIIIDNYAGDMP